MCGLSAVLLGRRVSHRARQVLVETGTVVPRCWCCFCLLNRRGTAYTPFFLLQNLPIRFAIDGVGSVFYGDCRLPFGRWPRSTALSTWSTRAARTISLRSTPSPYGVTLGISTAANILTLYFFYEFLTLCTLPLVMHGTQKPSEHAGYTYMLYSFFGAALAFYRRDAGGC